MKRIISLLLLMSILIISFASMVYSSPLPSELESTEEVKGSIIDLSNEEKEVLESLFVLLQEIMEMEEKEKVTELQIDELKDNIKNIEVKIEKETAYYDANLNIISDVLKVYQKNGANSYLELILSSDSLSILLKRINAIRDISRNTNKLLESIEASKEKLILEKQNISDTLELIEERQKELKEALSKKLDLKASLELSLAELQDERAKYEEYLSELEISFKEIKPIFTDTINTLVKMIESGNMPEESISLSLSLPNIKGVIYEDMFKDILLLKNLPTKLDIELSEDRMELIMPEINIYMAGTLEILNEQVLILKVMEGEYMGLGLEPSALEELFKDGYLELNFKQLLNKNIIKSVKILDDRIELLITPVLF